VVLRPLAWDTEFFGAKMGAITLEGAVPGSSPVLRASRLGTALREALDEARAQGYAHVIFRAPGEDLPLAWGAEQAGLRLVDVGLDSTYTLRLGELPPDGGQAIRLAHEQDVPALRELAASSFVLSRFSADPFFSPEQVRALHRQWITNLCAGLAQAVLVYDVGGAPAGFVSCALHGDEGRIPLIATDESQRGRGVGRSLVQAAVGWFAGAGARVAHVKTQAHNYPALALYHRGGFVVTKAELTFSAMPGGAAGRP
jgi:dTDP-4-amino-4,6-dideoxy-D-galactose acyltransferase